MTSKKELTLKHAVVKLINGEELICKVEANLLKYYKDFRKGEKYITIYQPMKVCVENYIEEKKPGSNDIAIFEKTIMTPWVRYAYVDECEIAFDNVLVLLVPEQNTIDKYEDLILKYHTYKTNPELAEDLYGWERTAIEIEDADGEDEDDFEDDNEEEEIEEEEDDDEEQSF